MNDELTRLQSAISAIHNHLHAGNVNAAHEACECAINGGMATQPNLSVPDSSKAALFGARFNELCASLDMQACFVARLPSATTGGWSSIQIGGEVEMCKFVESKFQKTSLYQGEHR